MKYDVIIVGSGPAGSTFARLISNTKYKVLLINGENEKNKKPCGGLISPDAQKSLAKFDLVLPKDVLVDPQIFSVKTIDLKSKLIRHYSRCYLNVDRYLFDKWLLSLVPSNVKIINSFCKGIIKKDNGYIVSCNNKEYYCKYLVGADGASSIVRSTFFNSNIFKYMAIQEWFLTPKNTSPFYSCIFDPLTSKSCSWSLNKDNYLIYGGCFEFKNSNMNYELQKKRVEEFLNIDFGKPVKREACLAFRPRKYSDFITGKDNIFLLGEASGFISPSSFEGISYAIDSGKYLYESFLSNNISRTYKRKTRKIKNKLMIKCIKRWFMYIPIIRYFIMKFSINSINVLVNKK